MPVLDRVPVPADQLQPGAEVRIIATPAPAGTPGPRLDGQGGVLVDDVKIDDPRATIDATRGKSVLLKVGKRRFARVTFA